MRLIAWLLVVLLATGWLAAEIPLAETRSGTAPDSGWRRTAHGWERPSWRASDVRVHQPTLHPVVVGLVELFLASAALIAFSGPAKQHDRSRRKGSRARDRAPSIRI